MKRIKRLISWFIFIFTFSGVIAEEARKEGIMK